MSAARRRGAPSRRRAERGQSDDPGDAAALHPGRPRLAAGRDRPGGDLDHLPVPERPLPLGREPDQPDAPDHRGRPDLGRHRLRAAARRDRPLGRRGQRPAPRLHGGPQRQARLEPLPGDRRGDRRGHGDRRPPGLPLQPFRGPLVRRHPGRVIGLAGCAAAGARLDRVDQPHRLRRSPASPTPSTPTRSAGSSRRS